MSNYQYRCCGCENKVESPNDLSCPKCGCELEIDADYYIQRIVELEAENANMKKQLDGWALFMDAHGMMEKPPEVEWGGYHDEN
jgi:hypothetical protein